MIRAWVLRVMMAIVVDHDIFTILEDLGTDLNVSRRPI